MTLKDHRQFTVNPRNTRRSAQTQGQGRTVSIRPCIKNCGARTTEPSGICQKCQRKA